jgi:hypothetical protein
MNLRLVAYRKATSGASSTTAYNLDLQEAPNVSLNFQFSEIKEPETRKGSYSQTFKLPFTDNNNQFFQDWYNVNLETLVFSTRTKFDAVLYVGAVPQFEGALQLKSVFKKAEMYEVVLMSSSASLFSTIGEQRLKDVFKNDDGSYDDEFNHLYNETQILNSWAGSSSAFVNTAGVSLKDPDTDAQKIMYPMSITQDKFYYDTNFARYLNLDQTTANSMVSAEGVEAAFNYAVNISQFRPAVQLRAMLNLIFAKAGFSYKSTFLGTSYFGRLYMTTGTHLELSSLPTTNTNASPSGLMQVSNSSQWGVLSSELTTLDECVTVSQVVVPANTTSASGTCTTPADPDSVWNSTYNFFTKKATTMQEVTCQHKVTFSGVKGCNPDDQVILTIRLIEWDNDPSSATYNSSTGVEYASTEISINPYTAGNNGFSGPIVYSLPLESMPLGKSAQIIIDSGTLKKANLNPTFVLGDGDNGACGTFFNTIRIDWVGYSNDVYGATVDFPACIDESITQKAFLKDLVQRFNLVIITDPNDDTNLLIEPYNDFIASGELKYWTNKIDTSKEIVVKDTTQLQKKIIHLTDKEDEDLYNKSFKERYPDVNVFGHLRIDEFNNDFASGEFKVQSLFSPFINGQVFANDDEQFGTYLPNMTVQYEFSYEENEGVFENKTKKTNPKLFYYNGAATNILDGYGTQTNIHFHRASLNALTAYAFNTYPICSPFDINGSVTLTDDTLSLYWNATPPIVGNLSVFNYTNYFGNWFNNTLYGRYWKPYLDNIYSTEARIMECYLNLNEVDIFNFSFADEVFIKDTYWRVLNISNYQVGAKASTKVTLIKSLDTKENCNGCDYVTGSVGDSNLYADTYYLWCAEDNPGCTPDATAPNYLGVYTTPECCTCNGGMVMWNFTAQASNNLYPCIANSGSLPLKFKSIFSSRSILNTGQLKTLIYDKIGGRNKPFVQGVNNTKYSQSILPLYGDDMVIKYSTVKRNIPQIQGESHKIVLSGNTTGTTKGYAYPESDQYGKSINIPDNINMIIRVKGIATVIGGTSATYTLGYTEGFAYYTAFRIANGTTTQLSTAGGQQEFSIREGANPTTCTLDIDISSNVLRFGLEDSQTDTKRVWQLSADIDINRINNMSLGFDENWALYQNGQKIQLQNGDYLIWN